MEVSTLSTAGHALVTVLSPEYLQLLVAGVLIGLVIGVIPGLGGVVGMAMLIPFTYALDAYAAFAFLIGMAAVTHTSDTIPAVLFGVPGTTGSAATVLDGHPLAKKGQAGRAFGAGFAASLLGGLCGAALLAISIPVLRPVLLYVGSPESLALTILGLSMVAVLSAGAPLRGLTAAAIGLMAALIGADPQTGEQRWTFGILYLWDGLPLVPVTLGLFAIPELADLAGRTKTIAESTASTRQVNGLWRGVRDVYVHRWLMLRCSLLGTILGAVPGLGSAVIDWIAYGHALRSERNTQRFGHGDIRGVIASESSNNAKSGGALVPTIAFGIPGSASMAILLGAFLMHGLVPGPEMLDSNLDLTYSIVWSLVLANVLGAGLCMMCSNQLALIAKIRLGILLPVVLTMVFVGAFQGTRALEDLVVLLALGVLGVLMKRFGWPRPPLILGFILGDLFERYLFISIERYGSEWLSRPIVIAIGLITVWGVYQPIKTLLSNTLKGQRHSRTPGVKFCASSFFTLLVIILLLSSLFFTRGWSTGASRVPHIVTFVALICAFGTLSLQLFVAPPVGEAVGRLSEQSSNDWQVWRFFAWQLLFLALLTLIGFLPGIFVFVSAYMLLASKETKSCTLLTAGALSAFCWVLCDYLLAVPWPTPLLFELSNYFIRAN